MSGRLSDDQLQRGPVKDAHLSGEFQDGGVVRDEAVPAVLMMMQGEEQLPVVHFHEPFVELTHRDELGLQDVLPQGVYDRNWKVLVEGEPSHASSSKAPGEVLRELVFEFDSLAQGLSRKTGIERPDPLRWESPAVEGIDGRGLDARPGDVR